MKSLPYWRKRLRRRSQRSNMRAILRRLSTQILLLAIIMGVGSPIMSLCGYGTRAEAQLLSLGSFVVAVIGVVLSHVAQRVPSDEDK